MGVSARGQQREVGGCPAANSPSQKPGHLEWPSACPGSQAQKGWLGSPSGATGWRRRWGGSLPEGGTSRRRGIW